MSTGVTHGADTDRLRAVAQDLSGSARTLLQVQHAGASSMGVLVEAWAGADTEVFAADWQRSEPLLAAAAERLSTLARLLVEQAEEQDRASGGGSPGASAPGPKDARDVVDAIRDVLPPTGGRPDGWFPDLRAAGPEFGVPGSGLNYVVDKATDWANKKYVEDIRDKPFSTAPVIEWGLREGSEKLKDASNKFREDHPWDVRPFVVDVVADELETYADIVHDPKGWWDNDATTWDKVGIGISLIPLGVLGKVAVKSTKEAFDAAAKGLKRADDAKPHVPHGPKKSHPDPGSDAHDSGNPNKGGGDDGYHGKHVRPDTVPDAPRTSLPPGQHVDLDDLPPYHREDPIPSRGREGDVYDPDFDRYAGMSKQEFYDKWYDPEAKNWRYPSKENGAPYDDGFAEPPRPNNIRVGAVIDRLGQEERGFFAAPDGTAFNQRALPPSDVAREYHRYRVVKPLPESVTEGRIQPWFDQPGGAVQYKFDNDIDYYLEHGYLERI